MWDIELIVMEKTSNNTREKVPVDVFDLEGNLVTSCDSIYEAALLFKLDRSHVTVSVKNGKGRTGQYMIRKKDMSFTEGCPKKTPSVKPYHTYNMAKEVDVYGLNGDYIASYKSINVAARELNLSPGSICGILKKGFGRVGQYQFRHREISVPYEVYSLEGKSIEPCKTDNMPKEVNVYDLSGKRLMTCKSISEASRKLNVHIYCIRNCVQGKYHRAGQYIIRKAKEPRKKANATSEEKPYLVRVDYCESNVRKAILYRLVPYTGENRCVKCAFAYDERNCAKHKCTTPDGKNGYFSFFCEESRRDFFVAQV